jgi:FkbM family methyltransferase
MAYRLGPLSCGLRTALNRAVPTGLTEVEVAGGILAGNRLMLNLQTEKDYWLGTYEMDVQQAIGDLVKPGMVVFDLGANIGYVSLSLAKSVGKKGKVFAFEPLPENQERFMKNLALNPDLRVELILKAVADVSGKSVFLIHSSGGMGKVSRSNGRNIRYEKTIEVDCISIDDFVLTQGNPKPDLIKVDVEGGEGLALQGMGKLIRETKPLFVIELHGKEAASRVWEILMSSGYTIRKLRRGYPKISDLSALDWKSYILARIE